MILCSVGIVGPVSLTSRFDYFNDKDGVRTGIPQELKAFALSPRATVAEGPDLIGEVRYDWSNRDTFTSDDLAFRAGRLTSAFQILYNFWPVPLGSPQPPAKKLNSKWPVSPTRACRVLVPQFQNAIIEQSVVIRTKYESRIVSFFRYCPIRFL